MRRTKLHSRGSVEMSENKKLAIVQCMRYKLDKIHVLHVDLMIFLLLLNSLGASMYNVRKSFWFFYPPCHIQKSLFLIVVVIEENGLSVQYWSDSPFSSITTTWGTKTERKKFEVKKISIFNFFLAEDNHLPGPINPWKFDTDWPCHFWDHDGPAT